MPAYCLVDNRRIDDPEKLERYRNGVVPLLERFGGRCVVLGGKVELREGDWKPTFPILLEFPSFARATEWYDSEEYRALKALRRSAGDFNVVFFEEARF